jgi:plasmid stabilization system protein ParE
VKRESVRIHPAALEEAVDWYAERSLQAAVRFLAELRRVIQGISGRPERFPTFEFGTRRAVLRKFPYLIVFRETVTGMEVLAVTHGRRRPGYWRNRMR